MTALAMCTELTLTGQLNSVPPPTVAMRALRGYLIDDHSRYVRRIDLDGMIELPRPPLTLRNMLSLLYRIHM